MSTPADDLRKQINLVLDDLSDYWLSDRWKSPMKVGETTFEEKLMQLATAYADARVLEALIDERQRLAPDNYRGRTFSNSTNWEAKFNYFIKNNEKCLAALRQQQAKGQS